MKEYSNYVFDLYGTLADIHTDEDKNELWDYMTDYFAERGAKYAPGELKDKYLTLIQELKDIADNKMVEIDLAIVFSRMFEDKGVKADKQEIDKAAVVFRHTSMEKLRLFDGAEELLTKLRNKGKKVYLLTNAQRIFTYPELEQLDLIRHFDGILISSDIGFKKPSYVFYWKLFNTFLLNKADTVMVGNDDMADCHGAADYGIDSIYIYTEQSPVRTMDLPQNCVEIKSLREII